MVRRNKNNEIQSLKHVHIKAFTLIFFVSFGKTSIVRRILPISSFVEEHVPTVEELYQVKFRTRNSDITIALDLLDTSGTYPFPAMRDLAIRTADAFILVYAVDDQDSLDEVSRLKEHILELREHNVPPLVVVANKIDLIESRVIDLNLIDSIISIDWEFGHVECSAKNNENIKRILLQLIRQKIINDRRFYSSMEEKSAIPSTLTPPSSLQMLSNNSIDNSSGSSSESDADISPSRSSTSSDKLFFGEDFYGSLNSLDSGNPKANGKFLFQKPSSIIGDQSDLEIRLMNAFKNPNCIIS
ncbi:GTP-binding Ras-like protein [Sarcoptes scabiei]|uniref:GTP-binding Ras-like protein n=1 Tax=Sarcoptes scabiei TaxID=52283 RepID=A0A132AGY8_SARSC|nr:GTP-binding Ras-like protein [Sarcoptes scabiei]